MRPITETIPGLICLPMATHVTISGVYQAHAVLYNMYTKKWITHILSIHTRNKFHKTN